MPKDKLKNSIIFQKYKLLNKIGKGSFGYVYEAENILNNTKVAVKLEEKISRFHLLELEASFLTSLKVAGFPKILGYGLNIKYYILIEELLGENLEEIKSKIYQLRLKDLAMIAIQIIDRIEYLHSKGIIHRDIKPENFLLGLEDKTFLHLIDFGISKKYRSSRGNHIKYSLTGKLFGTLRFTSYNATRGVQQSRRDDLESIGYMLVYLSGYRLPWELIATKGRITRNDYENILELKKSSTPEAITHNLPKEFSEYIKYCRNLKFEETPDYEKLRNLFKQILLKNQYIYDYNFSWLTKIKTKTSNKNKINYRKDDFSITSREKYINLLKRKQSPQIRLYNSIKRSLNKELSSFTKALLDNKLKEDNNSTSKKQYITDYINNDSSKEYISNNLINDVHYNFNIEDIGKDNINAEKKSKIRDTNIFSKNNFGRNGDKIRYSKEIISDVNFTHTCKIFFEEKFNKNKLILHKKKFNLSLDLDKNFFLDNNNNNKKLNRCLSEKKKNFIKIKKIKGEAKRQRLCKNVYTKILNKYNNYIELIRKKIKMRNYKKLTISQNKNNVKKKNSTINKYFTTESKYRTKNSKFFVNKNINSDIKNNNHYIQSNLIENFNNNDIKIINNYEGSYEIKNKNNNNYNTYFNREVISKELNNNKFIIINNNFNNPYSQSNYINFKYMNDALKMTENRFNKDNYLINQQKNKCLYNGVIYNNSQISNKINEIKRQILENSLKKINYGNHINTLPNNMKKEKYISSHGNTTISIKEKNNNDYIGVTKKTFINNIQTTYKKKPETIKVFHYRSIIKNNRNIKNNTKKESKLPIQANIINYTTNLPVENPARINKLKANQFKAKIRKIKIDYINNKPDDPRLLFHKDNLSKEFFDERREIRRNKLNNQNMLKAIIANDNSHKRKLTDNNLIKNNNRATDYRYILGDKNIEEFVCDTINSENSRKVFNKSDINSEFDMDKVHYNYPDNFNLYNNFI